MDKEYLYESLSKYFNVLKKFGYKDYNSARRILFTALASYYFENDFKQYAKNSTDRLPGIGKGGCQGVYSFLHNSSSSQTDITVDNALSATSTNPVQNKVITAALPTKVSQLVNDLNYLTKHQELKTINNQSLIGSGNITITGGEDSDTIDSALSETSENPVQNKVITEALKSKVDQITGKSLSTNDYTDTDKAKVKAAITEHQDLSSYAKKTDLPTKVSELDNDSNYLTEHQKLKTINGESLLGTGDIAISGGEGGTSTYSGLTNKPAINNVTLIGGNNTLESLGIQARGDYVLVETGKGLSSNDYTDEEKAKVATALTEAPVKSVNGQTGDVNITIPSLTGYATQAWVEAKKYLTEHQSLEGYAKLTDIPTVDSETSTSSTNPVQNKVITEALASCISTLSANYAAALDTKVDKETGKGLSTNDYTDADKTKVANALTSHQDLSEYVKSASLSDVATSGSYNDLIDTPTIPTIPTNVSAFNNDVGYLTEHQSLTDYAKKTDLPTKVSELQNDKGYLTSHQDLSGYAQKSELPTKTSQLTNDSGYLTSHQNISGKANVMSFVANSSATPSVTLALNAVTELTSTAITTITVTLPSAPTTNVGKTQEAILRFVTPSTAPTVTFPSGIRWIGGSAPTIEASTYYEFSAVYVLGGWNVAYQSFKTV